MPEFKNIILLFSFCILFLTGCFLIPPGDDDSSGTTTAKPDITHLCIPSTNRSQGNITVSEITGELRLASSPNGLPEKFTLELSTCIKGPLAEKIPHASFWISSNEENIKEYEKEENEELRKKLQETENTLLITDNGLINVEADEDGCLNWTEEYDYKYNKQSQWFISNRFIVGRSQGFRGTHLIPLIVNPWLQLPEHKKMQDYRQKYRDESIEQYVNRAECLTQATTAKKNTEKLNIIVDQVNFTAKQRPVNNIRYIDANIKATLKYVIRDIYGKPTDIIIDRGNFIIKPKLLILPSSSTNSTSTYTILNKNHGDLTVPTEFRKALLHSEDFTWELALEAYDYPIALYLQVIPKGDTAKIINPFEGIYRIGAAEQLSEILSNNKTLYLNTSLDQYYRSQIHPPEEEAEETESPPAVNGATTDPDKSLIDCIKDSKNILECISNEPLTIHKSGVTSAGWGTAEIKLGFISVAEENWLSRRINTQVRTRIIDPNTNGPQRSKHIDIKVTDLTTGIEKIIQGKTTTTGDITFTISTFQNWYKKQRYFLKLVHFSNPSNEMNEYKIIAINPWDYGFTHGYDVTQSESLSTTCLDNENQQEVEQVFNNIGKSNNEVPVSYNTDLIKKIFCYDREYPVSVEHEDNWWVTKFREIKTILVQAFRQEPTTDAITDSFYNKFNSSTNKPAPRSFIHLFRSLNPYPTYLIDSSLDRDFYYNMRFTVTPRVVRYDDIRAGQQNKGPIRDGIFLFQMAVLKNEQEKSGGLRTMVQVNANPAIIDTKYNGNVPLFNCIKTGRELESSDCLTEEDFLIPPVNIPIIIRDGTMKTDIKFLIQRKNLMFANSKNELVFRLLPADPDSVVCKGHCLPVSNVQYEANIDWEATSRNVRPAQLKDYDMFFHTYRTPLIPSEWNNWVVTNEINLTFDQLSALYEALSDRNTSAAKEVDEKIEEERQQGQAFVEAEQEVGQSIATDENINTEALKNHSEQLDQNMTKTAEQVSNEQLREHSETNELPGNPATATSQDAQAITPENISSLEQSPKTEKDFCLNVNQKINGSQEDIHLYNDPNCEPDSEDRMGAHLSYFARNNALCVIDINSDRTHLSDLSEESCGNFSNAGEAQTSFMDSLNQQIAVINHVSGKVKSRSLMPINERASTVEYLANNANSSGFKDKIRKLPHLPELGTADIEEIIQSGVTQINFRDQNISTFIHALCGLWFDQFLSNNYTNSHLLLNGFRRSMKKTFYYSLRGLSLPEDQGKEGEEQQLIQKINEGIAELEDSYNARLEQQNIQGYIDDIHKWVDGDDSFDSAFHNNLHERFTRIAEANHLSAERPSWTEPSVWDRTVALLKGGESEDTNTNGFSLADYLQEAVITQERSNAEAWSDYLSGLSSPSKSDLHPVRKCISNPFHFFGFEKKVIVGEVNKNSRYGRENGKGGTITTLNISEEFLLNSQKVQGGQQSFDANITANAFIFALPLALTAIGATGLIAKLAATTVFSKFGLFGATTITTGATVMGPGLSYILSHLLAPSLMTGAGYNYRSYEDASRDKMLTLRVSQAVRLIAEHTPLTMQLNSYKECLVVRPRFSAFETYTGKYEHIWATDNKILRSIYENIGVLLCSNGTDPERKIEEDYYYVYPDTTINGVSANPLSIHNKPFIISLRGKNEWNKFKDSLNCYVTQGTSHLENNQTCMDSEKGNFDYLFNKNIEFADNLRTGFHTPRLMHLTGHSPGVYSAEIKQTDVDDTSPSRTRAQKFMNFWSERSMMDMDIEGIIRNDTEIQNE